MDFEIDLLKGQEIPILIDAIKEIMQEGDAHNLHSFDQNRWNWQYLNLPSRKSYIYIVRSQDKILAYYHVPIYRGKIGNKIAEFAMVQDVAVSNKLRGRGIFKLISEYATADLLKRNIDLAYSFPNDKSIHTFLKYNDYKLVKQLPTYLLPLEADRIIKTKLNIPIIPTLSGKLFDFFNANIRKVKITSNAQLRFDDMLREDVTILFENFATTYDIGLIKDREYLTWRFVDKPNTSHYYFSLLVNKDLKAAVILKLDTLLDLPCLLIMDYAYKQNENHYLLQLLQLIRTHYKDYLPTKPTFILVSAIGKNLSDLKKCGFLKVPDNLSPRPLNLITKNIAYAHLQNDTIHSNWQVTFTDWDVF